MPIVTGDKGVRLVSNEIIVKRLHSAEDARLAFPCMCEVPTPWPKALEECRAWIGQNLGRHVEGYHLYDPSGSVVGQLYYAPSEHALVPYEIEPGMAVMYCEWVQRRQQGKGLGRQLFTTFKEDAQSAGCKGIVVEGTDREEQMPYQRYLARGFKIIHETDDRKLLYLPLRQAKVRALPLQPRIPSRRGIPVEILILTGYLCPFETPTRLLLLEVAREFGDRVLVRQEPLTKETLRRYGAASGIFINGRPKLAGATSEDAIRQAIMEEL